MLCRDALAAVAAEVNAHGAAAGQAPKTLDEVAMGFIRVANETMCRPIRALTQMKVRACRCQRRTCARRPAEGLHVSTAAYSSQSYSVHKYGAAVIDTLIHCCLPKP